MHDFSNRKMYFKRFSNILQAAHQNHDHTGITASFPIQREAQTKTLTKNIFNYKEVQNLTVPVLNGTKILDSSVCVSMVGCASIPIKGGTVNATIFTSVIISWTKSSNPEQAEENEDI